MSSEYREIMTTNAETAITHLTRIAPKPVEFTPLQSVIFACSGPKCFKKDGAFPRLHAEAGLSEEPIYTELWCSRCGAVYLVTWGYGDVPMQVSRRGWRDVESDESYGRLHGQQEVTPHD